ncbi:MAG: CHAT domain-containing protein, partial [Moraxellaceae bacterium]
MSNMPTDAPDDGLSYAMLPAGVLRVTGADRVDLLHRLSTQDLRPLRTAHKAAQTLFTTAQGKELTFLSTAEGDQSVTWESGIPKKMIENNSVYYVNVSHGALANEPGMFRGIEEILERGETSLFTKTRPVVRGTEKLFKTPIIDDHDLSPEAVENTLLGLSPVEDQFVAETPLKITVSNGDLRYASFPLIAGHFLNDGITSAEGQIDRHLNYALSDRNQLGIYPGEIGSSEVFVYMNEAFRGAVIIGLGSQSSFTAFQLTQAVELGVVKYLLTIEKEPSCVQDADGAIGVSALIVGSGYGGLSIENSVRAIIQGVQNANSRIKRLHDDVAATVQHLEFVELYEDAALGAFYSLRKIEKEDDRLLNISMNKKINEMLGGRKRILARNTEAWWNRIVVKHADVVPASNERAHFIFSASTGAARDLERTLQLSPPLIREMLDEISTNNAWTPELAKTIFELLVPNDFKEQLKRRSNASWVLDDDTAGYPWELLQDSITDAKPLCINAGMIRQLSVKDTAYRINTVTTNNALIVGDPALDGFVMQLPGALREADGVAKKLGDNSFKVTSSFNETAAGIVKKLFFKDYKIIHLAGHGVFNAEDPSR